MARRRRRDHGEDPGRPARRRRDGRHDEADAGAPGPGPDTSWQPGGAGHAAGEGASADEAAAEKKG